MEFNNNRFEIHDSQGLLHGDAPAVIDLVSGTLETYWHGLLISCKGKETFDIASLPDGFTMFRDVLYHVKNGKLSDYKNGRAVFKENGDCYTIDKEGNLECYYSKNVWHSWSDGRHISTVSVNFIWHDNRAIYYEYLSSQDKTATKHEDDNHIIFRDRFNRTHNLRGPAIISKNGTLEYWEFGLWQRTVNRDGTINDNKLENKYNTYSDKDGFTRRYNYNGLLHDDCNGHPAVIDNYGNKKWYTNNKMTKEEIAGKLYLVKDGVHTLVEEPCSSEPFSLVNMKQFNQEFPGGTWTQKELDDKVRWFLKTQQTPKQKLDVIANRFLTEDNETKVWKEVHNDLMELLIGNPNLVGWFTNKLGFQKVPTFIRQWSLIAQLYEFSNHMRIRDLYTSVYNHFAQKVVDDAMDLYEFMKAIPGCDLHQLVETLMKSKCENDVNWRLVIEACHLGGIWFDYVRDIFNSRYKIRHQKSKRYIYNFIVAKLELDTAFDVRGKLLDMALNDWY